MLTAPNLPYSLGMGAGPVSQSWAMRLKRMSVRVCLGKPLLCDERRETITASAFFYPFLPEHSVSSGPPAAISNPRDKGPEDKLCIKGSREGD